jgi:hypothetical protein
MCGRHSKKKMQAVYKLCRAFYNDRTTQERSSNYRGKDPKTRILL